MTEDSGTLKQIWNVMKREKPLAAANNNTLDRDDDEIMKKKELALLELDKYLPMNSFTPATISLLELTCYQDALSDKILAKIPDCKETQFLPSFNRIFFGLQLTPRVIGYSYWGGSK